jgi:hypothetical protein
MEHNHLKDEIIIINQMLLVMLRGFPITIAWRVLGLRMEERPSAMEGSCEYIK